MRWSPVAAVCLLLTVLVAATAQQADVYQSQFDRQSQLFGFSFAGHMDWHGGCVPGQPKETISCAAFYP